jgi:hypothetical protein
MKTIVAILASTILISGAYAQAPARSASAASTPDASTADAKRTMAVERHIKDMHAKLKITSAEESQWTNVAQTMRDSAVELDKAIDKREGIVNSATALDNVISPRPMQMVSRSSLRSFLRCMHRCRTIRKKWPTMYSRSACIKKRSSQMNEHELCNASNGEFRRMAAL